MTDKNERRPSGISAEQRVASSLPRRQSPSCAVRRASPEVKAMIEQLVASGYTLEEALALVAQIRADVGADGVMTTGEDLAPSAGPFLASSGIAA